MLNVACFVQSRLTDADFVIFSNYCLIGTRRIGRLSFSFAKYHLRLRGPRRDGIIAKIFGMEAF